MNRRRFLQSLAGLALGACVGVQRVLPLAGRADRLVREIRDAYRTAMARVDSDMMVYGCGFLRVHDAAPWFTAERVPAVGDVQWNWTTCDEIYGTTTPSG